MTEPIQRLIDRWRVWRHRLRGEPQIYVKDTERKRLGALVGLLMVVLVTSVVLGRMRLVANQRQAALEAVYAPAASALVEAEKIVGSNPLAAKDLLMNQRQVLERAILEYEAGSNEYNKLSSVLAQITTLYGVVSGERRLESIAEYYKLSIAREGMIGSRMGYGDGWLVVLDSLSGVAVGVEVKTKQTRLLAGGEILEGAQLVAVGTGKGVVYGKRGMVGVYWGGRAAEVLAQPEESLGEPGVLGMFGGNVYLSDRLSGDLWRYPGLDGGLGSRGRWFGPGVVPNLSNVQAIAVDGDVWLGSNDGKVTRYRQGAPLNFVIQGLDRPLSQVMAIAALYEDDEMFVLDGANNRLVVLGKDGVYRRQYLWEDMGEMRDMVVVADEEGGKTAYLLSEETIYRFPVDQ